MVCTRDTWTLNPGINFSRQGGANSGSVELEENEAVVDAFLASNKDFVRIVSDVSTALRSESGAVRTWPHREGVDGFFIAALERRS